MPERSRSFSDLAAYLSELDQGLREIEAELSSESARQRPATSTGRTGPLSRALAHARLEHAAGEMRERDEVEGSGEPSELAVRIAELVELQKEFLRGLSEAIASLRLAAQERPSEAAGSLLRERAEVSAGPFSTMEAVHLFEQALSGLPEVRRVALRGYAGEDRAVFDVQLQAPTS